MDQELVLLAALVGGPLPAKLIPLPESARLRYAKQLEARGYLTRARGIYALTPKGIGYALGDKGIAPPPVEPYFPDISSSEFTFNIQQPTATHPELEWVEYFFDLFMLACITLFISIIVFIRIAG